MYRLKIKRHRGRSLSNQQRAIAAVLVEAMGNYSENTFCAGWLCDLEHELWERIHPRKRDAYDRAVEKLYAAARVEQRDWEKPSAEFLFGLKTLTRRYQVWIYYSKARRRFI